MRTTLTLDDDVFEAARALVRGSGKTLGQVVSQLARRGLRSDPDFARKSGLPTFPVRADARIIPSDRAQELIAADDE